MLCHIHSLQKKQNTSKQKKEGVIKLIRLPPEITQAYLYKNELILHIQPCKFHLLICSKHLYTSVNMLPWSHFQHLHNIPLHYSILNQSSAIVPLSWVFACLFSLLILHNKYIVVTSSSMYLISFPGLLPGGWITESFQLSLICIFKLPSGNFKWDFITYVNSLV